MKRHVEDPPQGKKDLIVPIISTKKDGKNETNTLLSQKLCKKKNKTMMLQITKRRRFTWDKKIFNE